MNTKYSEFVTEFVFYESNKNELEVRIKKYREIMQPFLTLVELYLPENIKLKSKSFIQYLDTITMQIESQGIVSFSNSLLYDQYLLLDKGEFLNYIVSIKNFISKQYSDILGEDNIINKEQLYISEYKDMVNRAKRKTADKNEIKRIISTLDYQNRMRAIILPNGKGKRDRFVIDGCIIKRDQTILLYSVVSVLEENETFQYFIHPQDLINDLKNNTPVYIYTKKQFIQINIPDNDNNLYYSIEGEILLINDIIGKSSISDEAIHMSYFYAG